MDYPTRRMYDSLSLSLSLSPVQSLQFRQFILTFFLAKILTPDRSIRKPFMLSDKEHSVTNRDSKHNLLVEAASCGCVFFTGFEAKHDKT